MECFRWQTHGTAMGWNGKWRHFANTSHIRCRGNFVLLCSKIILINGVCICGKSLLFSVSIYLKDIFAYLFFMLICSIALRTTCINSAAAHTQTHTLMVVVCRRCSVVRISFIFICCSLTKIQESGLVPASFVKSKVAPLLCRRIHHSDEGEDEKYFFEQRRLNIA